MADDLIRIGDWVLIALVMAGAVPELVAAGQFLLAAGHFWRNHYAACEPAYPRTAILIPAWNEAAVIGASIDRLMALEYPPGPAADLPGRRREYGPDAPGGQGQGGAVPGPRGPPAPR